MFEQPHAVIHWQPEGYLQWTGLPSAKVSYVHGRGWRVKSKVHGAVNHVQRWIRVAGRSFSVWSRGRVGNGLVGMNSLRMKLIECLSSNFMLQAA